MHLTHLIIDDFFNDPIAIRNHALSMNYPPRPEGAIYPGRNAEGSLPLPGVERLISQMVQEPLQPKTNLSHCVPRIAMSDDLAKTSVHIDICHWSAIVYLSLDEHCQGEALDSILAEDESDLSKWEKTMTIPMKFNRLVLFRGYMWHDAGKAFGTTPETGRLILPMFFGNTQTG